MELIHEKNEGQKSRDTAPLTRGRVPIITGTQGSLCNIAAGLTCVTGGQGSLCNRWAGFIV